jgi:hypothetical protein
MTQSWKSSNINTSCTVFMGSCDHALRKRMPVEMLTPQASAVLSYGKKYDGNTLVDQQLFTYVYLLMYCASTSVLFIVLGL